MKWFALQAAGVVFAVFSLFFEDAEGFAGEIWPTFLWMTLSLLP